jgi:hypothetical protein
MNFPIEHHLEMLTLEISRLKKVYHEIGMINGPYDAPELQQVLYRGKWIYKIELKIAIDAHEARLGILRKIKQLEPISVSEHQKLLEIEVLAADPGIAHYLLVLPDGFESTHRPAA